MAYSTPAITSVVDLFTFANTETGYMFASVILIGFFMVSFMTLKHFSVQRAFASASFTTFLISIMLFSAGIVPEIMMEVVFFVLIIAVVVGK